MNSCRPDFFFFFWGGGVACLLVVLLLLISGRINEGVPNDRLKTTKPAAKSHDDKGMNMHIIVQRKNILERIYRKNPVSNIYCRFTSIV